MSKDISKQSRRGSANRAADRNDVAHKNWQFEQLYGKRLDAILIGTDDINVTGKDFTDVTKDLANLLRKSNKVSEKEKSRVSH